MKTVICRLDLGYTRIAGYTLYDDVTEEFHETTPREVKEFIKKNEVNGLKLVNDEIILDVEGFNQRNLMIKTAVGKYRPLFDADSLVTRMYAILDVVDCGGEFKYEVITNYCGRKLMTEEFVRTLSKMGYVAGAVITDEKIKLLNKKFSNQSNEEKQERDEEYNDIDETSEADAVISIEEEVEQGKAAIEEVEQSEVKDEDKPEEKEQVDEQEQAEPEQSESEEQTEEKVTEVTDIKEGTVESVDGEPEKIEFTGSEVEMTEVKGEDNVEPATDNIKQTEDVGVQTYDDQEKAEEVKEVTPKKKGKAKK